MQCSRGSGLMPAWCVERSWAVGMPLAEDQCSRSRPIDFGRVASVIQWAICDIVGSVPLATIADRPWETTI
jgi:hypothetical protein